MPFSMNTIKRFFQITLIIILNSYVNGQNSAGRVPDYPVPYVLPSVESIMEKIDKIVSYYENSSTQQILNRETGAVIRDFTQPNKYAVVSEGLSSEWTYTHGVVLSAFDYISELTGDDSYFSHNIKFYDFVRKHLPYFRRNNEEYGRSACGWRRIMYMDALDHCGSIGAALVRTFKKHNNPEYRELIDIVDKHVSNIQFRLDDGTLARERPQPVSVWADDMYMSVPFLSQMGDLTKDEKYWNDAVNQVLQMSKRLFIGGKDLFDHGWNENSADYDPRFYWGRANGWTVMAMADLLTVLPHDFQGRDEILHIYKSLIRSVTELQDGTGFWHNMLDKSDTYLETSCTAMFTYGIAKGINEGWISHVYGPVAQTGWNAVATRILENGAVDGTCEATTFAHDNVYYFNRGKSYDATHGYGPVLFAAAEMIRLLNNTHIRIDKAKPNSINSTYHYKYE
ncbi:MAG: glycoside hydrolase family 88 protein [Melioribacteraceae bacterium]|nr:glycoside hydrolase family 88 protein [Melioribacteraceae bacterium]